MNECNTEEMQRKLCISEPRTLFFFFFFLSAKLQKTDKLGTQYYMNAEHINSELPASSAL
jgi:hypothetical protein